MACYREFVEWLPFHSPEWCPERQLLHDGRTIHGGVYVPYAILNVVTVLPSDSSPFITAWTYDGLSNLRVPSSQCLLACASRLAICNEGAVAIRVVVAFSAIHDRSVAVNKNAYDIAGL